MARANDNFLNLGQSYLFSNIAKRVAAFKQANPDREVISMGIGDVTLPLPKSVVEQMEAASRDMGERSTFKGYGPEQGYGFLKELIVKHDYEARGVSLEIDEIFVSDGAKSDAGNISDIFSADNAVGVADPAYPVYVDTNVMAGRKVSYIPCSAEGGFTPEPPAEKLDIVYLCSPNNPTGSVMDRALLKRWVDWANQNGAVLIFDSAYKEFISDPALPQSIYEIEGAKTCAIEIRSYSKTAGFTGVRCGYTVVPKVLVGTDASGEKVEFNRLWNRRQTTRFNGASYISQRGAAAVYTERGRREARENIEYYMANARLISETLTELGIQHFGGTNAPYIWMRCPGGMASWEFFDYLLNSVAVVGTPGSGFGAAGEGWFRLTAFGTRENTGKAMGLLKGLLKK